MPHRKEDEDHIEEHEIEVGIPPIESAAGKKQRKKRRTRPGVGALREIRKMQQKVELVIPRAAFKRVVRELVANELQGNADMRITSGAFMALQEAAEAMMIENNQKANEIAMEQKRKGPTVNDYRLVLKHDPRFTKASISYDTRIVHVPSKRRVRKIKT